MEDLTCAKCSKLSNKILAMQCEHSLCIPCATKALSLNQHTQRKDQIQCQICGSISVLHKSSYKHLAQQSSSNSRHHQKQRIKEYYQNREDIQSMLFCLDCERTCFTIDDYLNGMHSGHNVKNVKRSGSILKGLLGEINTFLQQRIQIGISQSNKLIQRKKDLVQNFGSMKKNLIKNFQQIKFLIEQKERQLLGNLQQTMVKLFSDLDESTQQVKHYVNRFQSIHKQLYSHIQSQNNIKGFNYYSQRKEGILKQINIPIQNISREALQHVKCLNINTESITDTIQNIKRMNFRFGQIPIIVSFTKQNLIDDFFQAKRNQVFNETTKKDFKNTTLQSVKSMQFLKSDPYVSRAKQIKANRGVDQRLRELQILIGKKNPQQRSNKYQRY